MKVRSSKLITILLLVWALFQLYFTTVGAMDAIILRAYHAMFLVVFSILLYPTFGKKSVKDFYPLTLNCVLVVISVSVFFYMIVNYNKIAMSGGYLTTVDRVVAALGILMVIEAGRRVSRNLTILSLFFVSYLFWGKYVPGILGHSGFSLNRVLSHMFWGSQGIFGIGIGVSATYIFLFVLFGSFLKYSGFSDLINDLSLALVGRTPGGPAKVAVIASALMGMINGSAIANVATTGTITIPLMKKTGYSSEFSGAVEAVASTGGQFCPPIMGAVGFVMAEYLGIGYTKVMVAAILPAFLYYFGVMVSVHLEAKKLGLSGISMENIPEVKKVLKERGHLITPLIVLLVMLFSGFTPVFAAVASIISIIIVANLRKSTRMDIRKIILATTEGAKSAIGVGMACVLIGLIIGTVSLSGLGLNFGNLIIDIAGNSNVMFVGFMVMIMSVILGMGVPGVAAYVIVVAVAVPVLVKSGANPIAAHMFCLIYACLSNITPPVAMSSYIASGIAESDMTKTSLNAVKIGITGFLIPFLFLRDPILLLGVSQNVSVFLIVRTVITSIIGVYCIACATEGMILGEINIFKRIILLIAGILIVDAHFNTDIIGFVLLVVIQISQIIRNRKLKIS